MDEPTNTVAPEVPELRLCPMCGELKDAFLFWHDTYLGGICWECHEKEKIRICR